MSGEAGMLYRRHSFTVPASNVSSTDVCEIRGYHVRSGPVKRRVCQHCGARLCAARVATRECTEVKGHEGDHRQRLDETSAMEWAQSAPVDPNKWPPGVVDFGPAEKVESP